METVNNLTSAATRAIWGDPTETKQGGNETGNREDISGETGDVKAGEPYDLGNADLATQSKSIPTAESSNTTPDIPGNTASTGPIRPEHETDKTGVTSVHNPTSAISSDKPSSSNDNSGPGAAPSVGADVTSAQQATPKQQGADRPHEEPGSEEHDRIKETKAEAEEAAKLNVDGPGPKTLEEKAHESHGDVSDANASSGGDDDGPQKESHGSGTGEKYIKSSGMKVDGGDFDASNPGAGKEADRLLEGKGVHHTPGVAPPSDESTKENGDVVKEKVSLKDKIKAKLHKN